MLKWVAYMVFSSTKIIVVIKKKKKTNNRAHKMHSSGHFQAVKNCSEPDELPPPSADSMIAFMCTLSV